MSSTQAVLDAIAANDAARARQLIETDPAAATGSGTGGESPLLAAIYRNQTEVAALIAASRDVTLPEAAALGDAAAVRAILERDPLALGVRSPDGWTALHLAAFMGHVDAARVLLDAGADVEAVSLNSTANRPLHAALAGKADPELIELLLTRGADVNGKGEADITPLHLAAARGNMPFTRRLLDMNANPAAQTTDAKLPAAYAVERGHPEVAALLNERTGTA